MDEHDLARRAVQGDREAFGELVRLHQGGVYNTALRMTGNRQEAEDASQEAFLRAWRAIGSLDAERPPGPWLRRIAVNACLDRLERQPPAALEEVMELPSPEASPERQAAARERERQIRAALQQLTPRQRAAIELRHFAGLQYAEMAEALGRPLSDIKSDLFRARKALAERLKDLR